MAKLSCTVTWLGPAAFTSLMIEPVFLAALFIHMLPPGRGSCSTALKLSHLNRIYADVNYIHYKYAPGSVQLLSPVL